MTSSPQRIDFAFGLSQLSGNKTLYLSLLKRFSDEYRDIDDKVQQLLNNGDIEGLFTLFHTLKGVSANLGLPAIQLQCKTIESSLRDSQALGQDYDSFIALLEATLRDIDKFDAENDTTVAQDNRRATQARAKIERAIEAMEYIPEASLTAWLNEGGFTGQQRDALTQAITELDYSEALKVMKSRP